MPLSQCLVKNIVFFQKTAVETESLHTLREIDSDIETARLPLSPDVKSSISNLRLSLNQLRRLLGREVFREVIKKYKEECKQGMESASGADDSEDVARSLLELSPQNVCSTRNDLFAPNWNLNFDENIFEVEKRWNKVKAEHGKL